MPIALMEKRKTETADTEFETTIIIRRLLFKEPCRLKMNKNNRNAEKNTAYITRLAKSIERYGFLKELYIIVNSEMEILSGHHRYLAAREAESDLYYVVSDSYNLLEMSQIENIKKTWRLIDWFRFHANEGNKEYRQIVQFAEKTGFQGKALIAILSDQTDEYSGSWIYRSGIQDGTFVVYDWDQVYALTRKIQDFKCLFEDGDERHHTRNKFILAMLAIIRDQRYDHSTMMRQVKSQQSRMCLQRTRNENIHLLRNIYNKGLPRNKRLKVTSSSKS